MWVKAIRLLQCRLRSGHHNLRLTLLVRPHADHQPIGQRLLHLEMHLCRMSDDQIDELLFGYSRAAILGAGRGQPTPDSAHFERPQIVGQHANIGGDGIVAVVDKQDVVLCETRKQR